MLKLRNIHCFHSGGQILYGVSFDVGSNSIVKLTGKNGMGKSTLARSITGMVETARGRIEFNEKSLVGLTPYEVCRAGIALVPQNRRIFSELSVTENIIIACINSSRKTRKAILTNVFDLFPSMRIKQSALGGSLSLGEQQVLAIARALATKPKLLILDEVMTGLSLTWRQDICVLLEKLRHQQISILLIENSEMELPIVFDQIHNLEYGRIV